MELILFEICFCINNYPQLTWILGLLLNTVKLWVTLHIILNCSEMFRFQKLILRLNFSLVARCSLLFARCLLLFARCLLLFARCSLLVTFCSLLVTFCSLLVTFYSLLDKKFWRIFFGVKVNKRFFILICTKNLICD